jgi:hypothetical protein
MRRRSSIVVALSIAAGVATLACDRSPSQPPTPRAQSSTPPNVANARGAASPATQPAARPPVVLIVDEQPREFPPARLVVESRNNKTVALLMSDDPKEAIDDDYTGNSYYLEITFDEELDTIKDRVWVYQAHSADNLDSPHGIFLEGNRKELQPFDMKVQFQAARKNDPAGTPDVIWLSGTFYQTDTRDSKNPPRLVAVTGRIEVAIP